MNSEANTIEDLLKEARSFPPSESFKAQANVSDPSVYEKAAKDPLSF